MALVGQQTKVVRGTLFNQFDGLGDIGFSFVPLAQLSVSTAASSKYRDSIGCDRMPLEKRDGGEFPPAGYLEDLGPLKIVCRVRDFAEHIQFLPVSHLRPENLGSERRRVPDPGRGIEAPRGDPVSIRTEGQTHHTGRVTEKGEDFPPGRHVPQLDRPIGAGRSQATTIRAERRAGHNRGVADQTVKHSAALRVPDLHCVPRISLAATGHGITCRTADNDPRIRLPSGLEMVYFPTPESSSNSR